MVIASEFSFFEISQLIVFLLVNEQKPSSKTHYKRDSLYKQFSIQTYKRHEENIQDK